MELEYDRHNRAFGPTEEEVANYKSQVKLLNNNELFDEYTSLAGGDDYDGCHTKHGLVVWNLVADEFKRRLKTVGYF